jgi:23S rRNA (cytosine1962-C5)-methyltransferase
MSPQLTVRLLKPLERTVSRGHPWVFRAAMEACDAAPGTVLTLLDRRGRFLARGLAEEGAIGMRVFTTQDEEVDDALLRARVEAALRLRARVVPPKTDCYRLLHGEGDRLPGVTCDRYGAWAVLRFDGAAALTLHPRLIEILREPLGELGVENLLLRSGRGDQKRVEVGWGTLPDGAIPVTERGMVLLTDLQRGQKTGLFLDHRESRHQVRTLASQHRVLNLYAYTGGFSIAAGLGGATEVTTVDVADPAIRLAERSWEANGLDPARHEAHTADVQGFLVDARDRGRRWSLIVSDPPSFAPRQSARKKALRAYRALHRAVLSVLEPDGLYLAASCSSHVNRKDFENTLLSAGDDLGLALTVMARSGAGPDHPVLPGFPEGEYLTVTLVRALPSL